MRPTLTAKLIAAIFTFAVVMALFQGHTQSLTSYPNRFTTGWQTVTGFVPNSAASVTTVDSYVDHIHLANISGNAVTCTLTDASTNCSSGNCQWWPTISINANQVYNYDLGGVYSPSGVKWSCSSASAVVGWIRGKYAASN